MSRRATMIDELATENQQLGSHEWFMNQLASLLTIILISSMVRAPSIPSFNPVQCYGPVVLRVTAFGGRLCYVLQLFVQAV